MWLELYFWLEIFLLVNDTSLSNKKATVKSLTSNRLTDFLDGSNKDINRKSTAVDGSTNANQNSILDLGRAMFEADEILGEAPALIVASKSKVDPMLNLQAIIESYRVFREEVSSVEDLQLGDQLRWFLFQGPDNPQLENVEMAMSENVESLEELVTEETEPVIKKKQTKKIASPADKVGDVKKTWVQNHSSSLAYDLTEHFAMQCIQFKTS